MGTSIFSFVIVLGVLIFFHELGHFLVARLFGVGVEKFSLGFGPKVFGRKVGMTEYLLSAIPLGGYVKMMGEEPGADVDAALIPYSFTHKHVFKRILIVAAGPTFNLLLAFLIFFGIYLVSGLYILEPVVGKIQEGTPALEAGLKEGDRVLAIGETKVTSWDEMAGLISESDGEALEINILRGESETVYRILPRLTTAKNIFGEEIDRYVIGVSAAGKVHQEDLNPVEAFVQGGVQTWNITRLTFVSIVKLFQGSLSAKTLGGPIMIAQMAGEQAQQGISNFVFFIALLSINLAILNFLPIPVLDGGHLVFFTIEAVIGRPVSIKVREIAQQVGIFLLVSLMIYVFYNDITRVFFS